MSEELNLEPVRTTLVSDDQIGTGCSGTDFKPSNQSIIVSPDFFLIKPGFSLRILVAGERCNF